MARRLMFDIRRQQKERVYRHLELDFDEREFRDRFRFSIENVEFITNIIEPKLCRPTLRSHAIPADTQVKLALRYFASGSPMRVIGDTIGYHISSVSRAVRDVSNALCDIAGQYITWPSTDVERNMIKTGFYDFAHFPGVVGAIDCTHVRIQAPPGDYEYAFVNRKGYHSINVQGVCDHTGKFLNIVSNWPGSCHDSFIFRASNLCQLLERSHRGFDLDGVLIGDSGYPCNRYLVTPYLHPGTEPQRRYNNAHVKTRASVERSFRWLNKRFQLLHGEIRQRPERAVRIITACTILHNLALRLGEPMDDAKPEQADQLVPDQGNDIRHVRDYITRIYFA